MTVKNNVILSISIKYDMFLEYKMKKILTYSEFHLQVCFEQIDNIITG